MSKNRIKTKHGIGFNLSYIVKRERKRLRDLLKNGLHKVYKNDLYGYWCDFGPDFSWNENAVNEYKALLADEDWKDLAKQVKQKLKLDFVKEIKETLKVI